MIKSALQYLIGLAQPRIEEINGKKYYFNNNQPELVNGCRSCAAIEISTLTSLVDYIKKCMNDDFADGVPKMIVHVVSETEVKLLSVFNDDMNRLEIANVRARLPRIVLNEFVGQESFIIQMQSMFVDNSDRAIVMRVAGNVEDKTVANYGDDE